MAAAEEHVEEALVMGLEPDQLSLGRRAPLPRARLPRAARGGLWVLRLFTLIVGAMVVYTFFASLF